MKNCQGNDGYDLEVGDDAGSIVDFYCHKAALVVEVDGDVHDLQQEEDARREKALREMGLRTCAEPVEALSVLGMMRNLFAVVGRIRQLILVL